MSNKKVSEKLKFWQSGEIGKHTGLKIQRG